MSANDFLSTLPDELLLSVFVYLTPEELLLLALVCKRMKRLAGDPMLWYGLFCHRINVPIPKARELDYRRRYFRILDLIPVDNNVLAENKSFFKNRQLLMKEHLLCTIFKYSVPENNPNYIFNSAIEFLVADRQYCLHLYFLRKNKKMYLRANYLTADQACHLATNTLYQATFPFECDLPLFLTTIRERLLDDIAIAMKPLNYFQNLLLSSKPFEASASLLRCEMRIIRSLFNAKSLYYKRPFDYASKKESIPSVKCVLF